MVDVNHLRSVFEETYGSVPRVFSAPGRVNLIGEHTDYNEGFVLPMAIDRRTYVAIGQRNDRRVRVKSLVLKEDGEFNLDDRSLAGERKWLCYVAGVAWTIAEQGLKLTGADLLIDSDVPIGGGLSSSAALEVATGKALTTIAGVKIDDVALALAAQQAETVFVGARVGIMDQLTAVLGRKDHALLIDCRSLEAKPISLANFKAAMVVCNTNVKHDLASSVYNQRRAECERGVELLKLKLPHIRSLRDITVDDLQKHESELPATVRRRCRHVVTENDRTLKAFRALRDGNTELLGRLMNASHESLRNDYEVSSPELDTMVQIALRQEAVIGARMTGGGFGGCTINIVRPDAVDDFGRFVRSEYRAATNIEPDIWLVKADAGTREEVSVPLS
ncbi:MAG TPA: galactokinase [Pyrinomonadaceae bacterium]|nr:galactokinase [Pyrinomonadaceae bacterium]